MPNKHAAIKDLRKNKRRAARNLRDKTNVKALIKQLKSLVQEGKKSEALAMVSKLQQATDKASKKNVLHRNKARRINSMAMKITSTKK
ncbi:30S ribosomal protein S20 [Patescibacteria group bacterium]|jgi:small subunit ribosomal protein S20|nr:30S ribosomal protein S20 [Patescibacteria group bacterium]